MTRLIRLQASDFSGLAPIQQQMLVEMADDINAAVELGQVKPPDIPEVLHRVLAAMQRAEKQGKKR